MPGERVELSRSCPHRFLRPARLPVPPPRLKLNYSKTWNLGLDEFGLQVYHTLMASKGITLQEIYDLAVKMGREADPRGKEGVKRHLIQLKKDSDEAQAKRKRYFDPESLKNPYSDSRILYGDPKKKISKVMAGIDAEAAEAILVDRLNQKGENVDLLISHHPSGHALASLHEVIDIQIDMFAQAGVPENVAHALFDERKELIKQKFNPLNHSRAVDAARLLDVPLLALHTVWDNLGNQFMEKYIRRKKYNTVGEILDDISQIPEFVEAIKGKVEPFIASGSPSRRAGKVIVGFTGGTTASKELYAEIAKAGVGTLIEMHMPEDAIAELKKVYINIIVAGHMAADSIGANIFLDELEKRQVEVIPCSGLIRVRRQ